MILFVRFRFIQILSSRTDWQAYLPTDGRSVIVLTTHFKIFNWQPTAESYAIKYFHFLYFPFSHCQLPYKFWLLCYVKTAIFISLKANFLESTSAISICLFLLLAFLDFIQNSKLFKTFSITGLSHVDVFQTSTSAVETTFSQISTCLPTLPSLSNRYCYRYFPEFFVIKWKTKKIPLIFMAIRQIIIHVELICVSFIYAFNYGFHFLLLSALILVLKSEWR